MATAVAADNKNPINLDDKSLSFTPFFGGLTDPGRLLFRFVRRIFFCGPSADSIATPCYCSSNSFIGGHRHSFWPLSIPCHHLVRPLKFRYSFDEIVFHASIRWVSSSWLRLDWQLDQNGVISQVNLAIKPMQFVHPSPRKLEIELIWKFVNFSPVPAKGVWNLVWERYLIVFFLFVGLDSWNTWLMSG